MNVRTKARSVSRGEARRRVILAAAKVVFLRRGFEAATLDEIIQRSGGSRATLYAQFGGKDGLFAAIVEDLRETITAPLSVGLEPTKPPGAVLAAFAQRYLDRLLEADNLGLYRLVIAEAQRFPALGRRVFAAGPAAAAATLAAYLQAETQRGRLAVRRPDMTARLFLEMIKGDLHTRALFGVGPAPRPEEIRRLVREAVRSFLDGNAA